MQELKLWRRSGGSNAWPWTLRFTEVAVTWLDDEDFVWASQWHWHLDHGYAGRKEVINGRKITIRLHNEILTRMGVILLPGQTCDHKNRVKLDNQRSNLRAASRSDQQANSRKKSSISGEPGVYRNGNCWQVKVKRKGKDMCFGSYLDKNVAIPVARRERKRLHGEFAGEN